MLKIVPAAPQRIFEYNAVKTAFEQVYKHDRIDLYNSLETGLQQMTIQDELVVTLRVKDFGHLLTEEAQPCAVNFWKHKLNADVNKAHWEAVFKSTKETRLRVLHWKALHNIHPANILLHKMGIETSSKCNACNVDEKDYAEHFSFERSKVKPIRKLVEN